MSSAEKLSILFCIVTAFHITSKVILKKNSVRYRKDRMMNIVIKVMPHLVKLAKLYEITSQ